MLLVDAIAEIDKAEKIEIPAGDGAFDVCWVMNGREIASGHYDSGGQHEVTIGSNRFIGMPARTLLQCGVKENPEIVQHNIFENKSCEDCSHTHIGVCTHIVNGKKCGCEYVNR